MYTLKQTPQDFIVREIPNHTFEKTGPFTVYELHKTGIPTLKALKYIAEQFRINESLIGYAGLKDAQAVTTQYITIPNIHIPQISQESFTLTKKGYLHRPLILGDLQANEFEIVVRNTENYTVHRPTSIINYFGEQRFSTHNCEIAKYIVTKAYEKAVQLIDTQAKDDWIYAQYRAYRRQKPLDAVGALQKIDKQLLTLYIHAYQSYLWNMVTSQYIQQANNTANTSAQHWIDPQLTVYYTTKIPDVPLTIPLIGFDYQPTQTTPAVAQLYEQLMQEQSITPRDFINRQLPQSTKEGSTRQTIIELQQLIIIQENDTIRCSFRLPKGSYATVAIAQILQEKTIQE
jgi:tRNA(Glu) U13 pseudouridine synthase TruD